MAEPEVALVFTPEPWVEELHRHLTDHGGARVRQLVVEPSVALEEHYDVLLASHRWPALTRGFVDDVRASGRTVLGIYDREEPAARVHLERLGVDQVLASDSGPKAFVAALAALRARRDASGPREPSLPPPRRPGRVVVVGGPAGSGRTEIALHLAVALGGVLVDADDVAPSVAQRLGLPIEPNLRVAIEATEHGDGDLAELVVPDGSAGVRVVPGLPNPAAWSQVRPGEVVRVVERLTARGETVVVDVAGSLDDVSGGASRGRFAVARALAVESDVLVGCAGATPIGIARFLSWAVEAVTLAGDVPMVAVVNRAPGTRFRRYELFTELVRSLPAGEVLFVPDDRRVGEAVWDGTMVARGPFTRAMAHVAVAVASASPRSRAGIDRARQLEAAS